MTLATVLVLAAGLVAALDLVETNGHSRPSWGVLLLAVAIEFAR